MILISNVICMLLFFSIALTLVFKKRLAGKFNLFLSIQLVLGYICAGYQVAFNPTGVVSAINTFSGFIFAIIGIVYFFFVIQK